jgi:serine/threonine protein kinase
MTSSSSLVGTVLDDRYRVDRVVGKGGMGTVYEGENVKIGKRVAVKVLLPELIRSEEYVTRFQREARAAGEIGHAHIVDVFDFGHTPDGIPYIIMEFLDGQGLDRTLEKEELLPPERAVDIAGQVLHALSSAHEAGIVHRDLKPENIFLCSKHDLFWQGESGARKRDFVKVLDFGISLFSRLSVEESKITQTGVIFGTPYYMSPEQARASKDIDFRSDLYAVGALLYTMLTGIRPFDGDSPVEILSNVIDGNKKRLDRVIPGLPEDLVQVVDRAMAVNPYKRFESAIDFMNALVPFSGRESLMPRPGRISDRVTVAENAAGGPDPVPDMPVHERVTLDEDPGEPDPEITAPDAPLEDEGDEAPVEPRPTRQEVPRETLESARTLTKTETPKTLSFATTQEVKRPSRLPLVVSMAVLLAGAIVIILLASRGARRDDREPRTEEKSAPASAPVAEEKEREPQESVESAIVTLEIAGTPEGASIFLDGHYFGKLPHSSQVRADGKKHQVQVVMEGYATEEREVTLHPQKAAEKLVFALGPPEEPLEEELEEVPVKTKKKPVRIKIPSADDLYGPEKKKIKIPKADDVYK